MSQIDGLGTAERRWRPFLQMLATPTLQLSDPPGRVVVVAPHPDDEILAVGGLLTLLLRAGSAVEVVAVTDGEASHPFGSVPADVLAARRIAETRAALTALRVPATVRRLRLPDGGAAELERPVLEALRLPPSTWLLGPWQGDGHPDHQAVGRACATAAARDGARLLSYPVWMWHWAQPGDARVPWEQARQVWLPPDVRAAKARAVAAFTSQVAPLGPLPGDEPVLLPHVLERFGRPAELVFT